MSVTVDSLYRSLSTESLLELRQAFTAANSRTTDPDDRAFNTDRLRLIARELATRHPVDSEGVPTV